MIKFSRHQILLSQWQYDELKKQAKENGQTISSMLRFHFNNSIMGKYPVPTNKAIDKAEFEARKKVSENHD